MKNLFAAACIALAFLCTYPQGVYAAGKDQVAPSKDAAIPEEKPVLQPEQLQKILALLKARGNKLYFFPQITSTLGMTTGKDRLGGRQLDVKFSKTVHSFAVPASGSGYLLGISPVRSAGSIAFFRLDDKLKLLSAIGGKVTATGAIDGPVTLVPNADAQPVLQRELLFWGAVTDQIDTSPKPQKQKNGAS